MSRRAKRWALITWAVLVASGGGATLVIENAGPPDDLVGVFEPGRVPSRSPAGGEDCSPPPSLVANDSDGVFAWSCLDVVVPSPPMEDPAAEYGHAPDPTPFPRVTRPGGDRHCPGEEQAEHLIVSCAGKHVE